MERGEAVVERDGSILYDASVPLTCVGILCVHMYGPCSDPCNTCFVSDASFVVCAALC